MADVQAEIQALQAIVTGLSSQSFSHRIQGLVFGSKGLQALADKYAEHAEESGVMITEAPSYFSDEGLKCFMKSLYLKKAIPGTST